MLEPFVLWHAPLWFIPAFIPLRWRIANVRSAQKLFSTTTSACWDADHRYAEVVQRSGTLPTGNLLFFIRWVALFPMIEYQRCVLLWTQKKQERLGLVGWFALVAGKILQKQVSMVADIFCINSVFKPTRDKHVGVHKYERGLSWHSNPRMIVASAKPFSRLTCFISYFWPTP